MIKQTFPSIELARAYIARFQANGCIMQSLSGIIKVVAPGDVAQFQRAGWAVVEAAQAAA